MKLKIAALFLLFAFTFTCLTSCDLVKLVAEDNAQAELLFVCHPHPEDWEHQCNVQKLECNRKVRALPEDRRDAAMQRCVNQQTTCLQRFPPCNPPKQCLRDPRVPNEYLCQPPPR